MEYVLFAVGIFILVKGAGLLVNGASGIARKAGVPDLVIGLTIVAFGTSAPELFVNVYASMEGNTAIATGNILGSNICNVFLILGLSASIAALKVKSNTVWKEIPLSLLAAVMVVVLGGEVLFEGGTGGVISRIDGMVLLGFFLIFLYYAYDSIKGETPEVPSDEKPMGTIKGILWVVAGLAGLTFGSRWIVDGAVLFSQWAGLSESVTGLTVVAIGTSLPELATSVSATLKGKDDIAIGNVVGSNIFNVFFIMGVSSVINDLPFEEANHTDALVTILSSLLLFLFLFVGKRHMLQRWQGVVFLVFYVVYLGYLIMNNPG